MHQFEHGGLYNGLFLRRGRETDSHWDYITGACVHGELEGEILPFGGLLQMSAAQTLAKFDDAQFSFSNYRHWMSRFVGSRAGGENSIPLPPNFYRTMGKKDERFSQMAIGVGVWYENNGRYQKKRVGH